jgi:S1-C subfamily serine protease
VAGVMPGSPADKAGIKGGNIIQNCSHEKNDIFKKSFATLAEKYQDEDMYYSNYENFGFTRHCDLEIHSKKNAFANVSVISRYSFVNTYMSTFKAVERHGKLEYVARQVDYNKKPLVFTVKDVDKKIKNITVRPENKRHYLFKWL